MMKTATVCAVLLLGAATLNAQQKPVPKESQPKQDAAALELRLRVDFSPGQRNHGDS